MKPTRSSAELVPGLTSVKLEGDMPKETVAAEVGMVTNASNNVGRILKHRRLIAELTMSKLSAMSGVSESHLCRIERGKRFPAPHTLIRLAKSLGFEEYELFTLIGFWLADHPSGLDSNKK